MLILALKYKVVVYAAIFEAPGRVGYMSDGMIAAGNVLDAPCFLLCVCVALP